MKHIKPSFGLISVGDVPYCPHCNMDMSKSTCTLAAIVSSLAREGDAPIFTFEGRVTLCEDNSGYAYSKNNHYFPVFTCPNCLKESLFSTDGQVAILHAKRTDKDTRFVELANAKFQSNNQPQR